MAEKKSYDCVVIGGGHNGLVAAAYLARGGKSVCVLERRHVLGGCATTEKLWPGYKVSTAAYVISLFLPQIIRELRLKQYGLAILPRNPSSFTPLLDGRYLLQLEWRALGRAQPVVPDHPLLVGVGDRAGLERLHGVEGALHRRLHPRDEGVVERHPAGVERQPAGHAAREALMALPELFGTHAGRISTTPRR